MNESMIVTLQPQSLIHFLLQRHYYEQQRNRVILCRSFIRQTTFYSLFVNNFQVTVTSVVFNLLFITGRPKNVYPCIYSL